MMKQNSWYKKYGWYGLMAVVLLLQLVVIFYFCHQKEGFHYDEYYSYYSSNKTYGLTPSDRQWKKGEDILSEFQVREGEEFRFGLVKEMQGFDVHPPLYYYVLHGVCSFFPGVFTKWTGLGINMFFFLINFILMAAIGYHIFDKDKNMILLLCTLYGFQPGVISGVTFIRMYTMLTTLCLLATLWHSRFWKEDLSLSVRKTIELFLVVFLGFLTHYYFLVFFFFLAAYTCLVEWWKRKKFTRAFLYGSISCSAIAAAVIYYPASLRHIFRGYRGTEAAGAFFDLSNTWERVKFFTGLMDSSVFGGSLSIIFILLILLLITDMYGKKREGNKKLFPDSLLGFCHLLTVVTGYFFVVSKTALLNAEEANRYQLPVYGLILLLILYLGYYLIKNIMVLWEKRKAGVKKYTYTITYVTICTLGVIIFGFQINALRNNRVQFLYRQDKENVEWAKENSKKAVVYCYNPNNEWMIWDEAEELMQYEKIYFLNLRNEEPIQDELLRKEEEIYLYSTRMEEVEQVMAQLLKENPVLTKREKIRELLYCDLYRLW